MSQYFKYYCTDTLLCDLHTRLGGRAGGSARMLHWQEHPRREREDTDSCPKIPARLLLVHANHSQEGGSGFLPSQGELEGLGGEGRWVRQGQWCLHSSSGGGGGGGKVPRPRAWKQKQEVREEEE